MKIVNSKFGTVRWACGSGLLGGVGLMRRREGWLVGRGGPRALCALREL